MRRKKNSKLMLGILIAIIALGVGYAAITGVNLLINGSATVTANGDFKVRFENHYQVKHQLKIQQKMQ